MAADSDNDSFKSAEDGIADVGEFDNEDDKLRFTPEEEARLVEESNSAKALGNEFFGKSAFSEAISTYDRALASCPNYLDFEIAVLRSNIAACHLKLEDWKAAINSATQSLDCLERLDPTIISKPVEAKTDDGLEELSAGKKRADDTAEHKFENTKVEEVDDSTAARIEALEKSGRSRADVQKIRIKALLRRAKARRESGGWANLQGAQDDYTQLRAMPELAPMDKKTVMTGLQALPAQLEIAKQQEMGELMGKLKDLGNGILKPFGLSTENFQFVKDENTGGYSMQFNQGGSK